MSERSHPLRNRVTPFGEIVAHPAYGQLMGNRGCLHDAQGRIRRTADGDRWISCEPRWPGVRRQLMAPGRYTELFFRDEATALAAGHRPCWECRKDRFAAFMAAWVRAHGLTTAPSAPAIDAVLRAEPGLAERSEVAAGDVPDGVMVTVRGSERAWLRWDGGWRLWAFEGYGAPEPAPADRLLPITPAAIIATIAAGYRPQVHIG